MLTSLSFIFLLGLAMAAVCQRLKLPRIIGMLLTGILLGPYALNLLDPSILAVSADLRQMALIIILLKAGLSLNLADLKRVGRPAVMIHRDIKPENIFYDEKSKRYKLGDFGISYFCTPYFGSYKGRSRCHGRCTERCFACGGNPKDGSAHGGEVRYR